MSVTPRLPRPRQALRLACAVFVAAGLALTIFAAPAPARAVPPSAPTVYQPTRLGYLAHPLTGWAVFVDWSDSGGATGYQIYNADTNALLASMTPSTYVFFQLPAGVYRYYVRAINAAAEQSDPSNTITVTFVAVAPSHAASGYRLVPNSAYDVGVAGAASAPATVTIPYDATQITGDASQLKLLHWNGSSWVDITTGIDTSGHTLSGRTTSFSDFSAAEVSAVPPTVVPASAPWSLALLALVGIGALGVAVAASRTAREGS